MRTTLIILDSLGIGATPDAAEFGPPKSPDTGANTLAHIAEFFAAGTAAHHPARPPAPTTGPLHPPHPTALGLAHAATDASPDKTTPPGLSLETPLIGAYAHAKEISSGKDTPSGHWELAGVPVPFDWSYFPNTPDCFPQELLQSILNQSKLPASLGNKHASGTTIIAELGEEHCQTRHPIFYTSADSVFQIAAHEDPKLFGLEKLYDLCQIARQVFDNSTLNLGRVIARPFIGTSSDNFERTGNRHDYAVPPAEPTILQKLVDDEGTVIAIGKIADIFAHTGVTEEIRASGHPNLWTATLDAVDRAPDHSLVITNFVDFDALYGHRRDPAGYGAALETFDTRLPDLISKINPDTDLLILTADHGNDPTWPGTDHTREHIPILLLGKNVVPGQNHGLRQSFADIAQTIAQHHHLPPFPDPRATSILPISVHPQTPPP
ncbi:MAG: phosphopentomutase [Verrucomicrobiota bacterium]